MGIQIFQVWIWVFLSTLYVACALVTHLCPTPCDPMGCSPPGSSVQAIILEWVAIFFSIDLPNPGIEPESPASASWFFTLESPGKPQSSFFLSFFFSVLFLKMVIMVQFSEYLLWWRLCPKSFTEVASLRYSCFINEKTGPERLGNLPIPTSKSKWRFRIGAWQFDSSIVALECLGVPSPKDFTDYFSFQKKSFM